MPNQIEFFEIPSPCKRICETDSKGYCLSCFRSRYERFSWLTFSNEEKQDVLRLCRQRAFRKRYSLYQQAKKKEQLSHQHEEQFDLF